MMRCKRPKHHPSSPPVLLRQETTQPAYIRPSSLAPHPFVCIACGGGGRAGASPHAAACNSPYSLSSGVCAGSFCLAAAGSPPYVHVCVCIACACVCMRVCVCRPAKGWAPGRGMAFSGCSRRQPHWGTCSALPSTAVRPVAPWPAGTWVWRVPSSSPLLCFVVILRHCRAPQPAVRVLSAVCPLPCPGGLSVWEVVFSPGPLSGRRCFTAAVAAHVPHVVVVCVRVWLLFYGGPVWAGGGWAYVFVDLGGSWQGPPAGREPGSAAQSFLPLWRVAGCSAAITDSRPALLAAKTTRPL